MRWFHGTSGQLAKKILAEGVLKPGQDSIYDIDVPRDAVYIASFDIAEQYAEERTFRGTKTIPGVVLEVAQPDPKKLVPDEDDVWDLLEQKGSFKPEGEKLSERVRQLWLQLWNEEHAGYREQGYDEQKFPQYNNFDQAWAEWSEIEFEGSSELSTQMKDLTDYVVKHDPKLAMAIIQLYGKAAHLGPIKVKGVAKTLTAAKKPEYIKTPGFVIEVPKERRKSFFVAPKAPLVYWAFKNRPRVFISEKLIFTFGGKPVAEALVAKVEGPGKGDGEYKAWHKVYWKPVTFKRFRMTTAADNTLYHVTLQKNVDDILENGLKAEYGYQFFDDTPKSTYLTERAGLPFWQQDIAQTYGEPQVVLKVDRSGLNLIPDEQGTDDAGAPAYRVEHDIPASKIKIAAAPAVAQPRPTDTPQFKAWFGKSKVVDKDGNPLVVYHGTVHDFDTFSMERPLTWEWEPVKDLGWIGRGEGRSQAIIFNNKQKGTFSLYPDGGEYNTAQEAIDKVEKERPKTEPLTLRPGFFFAGNPMYTHDFTYSYDPGGRDPSGANIKACYLRMEKPLDFRDAKARRWVREWLRMNMPQLPHLDPQHVYKVFREGNWAFVEGIQNEVKDAPELGIDLINDIKKAGFDGYITVEGGHLRFVEQTDAEYDARAKEMYGRGGLDSSIVYVVWSPYQIKSVFNSGNFDRENPSITASTPKIEKMKTQDEVEVIEVAKACFPDYTAELPGIVKESCHGDYSRSYVVREGGKIIGAYLLGKNQLPEMFPGPETKPYKGKKGIEGVALFVLPEYRGTGIGRQLRGIPLSSGADYIWGQHFEGLGNLQNWVNFGRKHLMTYTDWAGGKVHITVMDLKNIKTADFDLETDSGKTYWAGEGNAASGILPVCPQTGNVCLAWRSKYVQTPDCWGTIGGAVQRDKSPQESAKAELHEETGYSGGMTLHSAYVFTDGGFTYHNYIGVVSNQFPFSPKPLSKEEYAKLKARLRPEQYYQLKTGWETDHIVWVPYAKWVDDMNENPEDYHPGLIKLWKNSKDVIERVMKIEEEPEQEQSKQASEPEGFTKTISSENGTSRDGKWTLHNRILENPETGDKIGYTVFTSGGLTVEITRAIGGRQETRIQSSDGKDETIRDGSPRTHGSAVNNYTKKNFGFQWPYRPMHPFHTEPKKPYWKFSAFDPAWMKPWVTGKCWEFAIALSHQIPNARFVGLEQSGVVHHVGLFKDGAYYDVRGKMDEDTFNYGADADDPYKIVPMDYDQVMRDGEFGSWIGHEDEFAQTSEMKEAMKAVRKVFGKKTAEMLPTAQPPDVRILPCPSGKKKYFDKATVLMKARGLQGTPAMAYQCPKCHWWHMTSKPQHGPNPTYKSGAGGQGELFPNSQDAKFRQWFDGSKVVDQQGRPMPVYHGTRSSVNFDTFSVDGPPQVEDSYEGETTSSGSGWDPTAFLGAHFAEESRVANQFAQGEGWTKSRYEGESEAPRVIQVFLRILNPKDFGTESNLHNYIYQGKITDDDVLGIGCRVETGYNPWEGEDSPEVQKEIEQYYQKYENDQSFRAKENEYLLQQYRPMDMEDEMLRNAAYELAMQARHRLEQSGVDGIRYKNEVEGGHAWIAFAPQQIKSVYSNFNPQDQRFTASVESDATEIKIVPKSKGLESEAWYEGQRVGFVYLHRMEDAPGNPRAPQNSLMVDAAALASHLKGKSVGLKMYRAAIEAAREAGYARVYEGIEHSEDAANLWERLKQLYPTEFDEDWGVYYIPLSDEGKTADWKRNVLLPAALTLGLGAPNVAPSEITPQQQQIEQQRRQEAEAQKVRQEQIDKLIEAISRAEGAKPERNNPGNLADFTTGEIKSFDSLEEGREALAEQLNRIADGVHPFIKPSMTLREAGLIYSNGDPNWAHNVALIMHVPQSTKIGDIIKGVTQQADTGTQPSGRTGAWIKAAAGFAFKTFSKLWHVGSMNPNDKRNDSYEGAGLSVSVNPEEWQQIARIGGDLWELTKKGNKFVNFWRITKAQRKSIMDWAVANGFAEPAEIWRHSYMTQSEYSDEPEERYSDYHSEEEARAELGGYGDESEEKVEKVQGGVKATMKLAQRTKRDVKYISPSEVYDLVVTVYAEDELDCDGVWWADTLDPANLSAPRGVIFPSKLSSWKARKLRQAKQASAPKIVHRGPQGFNVELWEDNKRVGHLQIDVNGDTAIVKAVDVDENYQRQGIATKLYQAARVELKKRGVKTLKGSLEGSGPAQIRENVFGKGHTKFYHGGEEVDYNKAVQIMDKDYGYTRAETRIAKKAADRSWTREQAEAFLKKLPLAECGYSAKIVGSIATKGQSDHDLDVLLTPTSEDFDFERLLKYFNLIGADAQPTYDGDEEIWEVRLKSGHIVDFWFSQEEPKIASAAEPGLLWRAPEDNDRHDYQPSWDYEPRAENDPELVGYAVQIAKQIYQRTKQPFELWDVDMTERGAVAMYIDGTCGYPVVLIDLEAHRGYENQIGKSIDHELRHAIQDANARDYDEDEAESDDPMEKEAAEVYLYHGTSEDNWNLIMENGGTMPAGSHWGTERVAAYYAEDRAEAQTNDAIYNEMGTEIEEAIIRVPLSRFNKASLKPDQNSVAEPLTYTLKRTEEDLYADWQKAKGTWEDSLRIYESVRYDAPIKVTKTDRYV